MSPFNSTDLCYKCNLSVDIEECCNCVVKKEIHCRLCCDLLTAKLDMSLRPICRVLLMAAYEIYLSEKHKIDEEIEQWIRRKPKRVEKYKRLRRSRYSVNAHNYHIMAKAIYRNMEAINDIETLSKTKASAAI